MNFKKIFICGKRPIFLSLPPPCAIYYLVDATDIDLNKWKVLDDKIKEYIEACR